MRKAQSKKYGYKCAIKIIKKEFLNLSPQRHEAMMREMGVLKSISHPNSVRVYELLEDKDHFYIVSELAREGDLYQYFK